MKKVTLLLLATVLVNQLSAQFEPDSRFLFKKVWPIIPHDSIAYSQDSGTAFNPDEFVSMYLFPNDHIDSMNLYNQSTIEALWNGWRNGVLTRVASFDDPQNLSDTSALYDFYADSNGRDSLLEVFTNDGSGNMELDVRTSVEYLANGKVDKMSLYIDPLGTGTLIHFSDYIFHYNSNNRLDSVSFTNELGSGYFGKLYHKYDVNDKLIEFDIWEDDNDGNGKLVFIERYLFKHDAQGLVNEVIQMEYDSINSSFDLLGSWKYLTRVNTNISLQEKKKISITIYPNPAKDQIRIKSDEKFETYEIVSLTGKVVLKGKLRGSINVEKLHSGIYFLNLNKGDHTEIRKFNKL